MKQVFLGIDYGRKHIGLSIAHTAIAEPLITISALDGIARIIKFIDDQEITQLVVGISEGWMAIETKQFVAELKAHTNLPIHLQDETLSSFDTRVKLAKAKVKKSKREAKIDHYVSAAILQDYLDSRSSITD